MALWPPLTYSSRSCCPHSDGRNISCVGATVLALKAAPYCSLQRATYRVPAVHGPASHRPTIRSCKSYQAGIEAGNLLVGGWSWKESLSTLMQASVSVCSLSLISCSSFIICKLGKITALTMCLHHLKAAKIKKDQKAPHCCQRPPSMLLIPCEILHVISWYNTQNTIWSARGVSRAG